MLELIFVDRKTGEVKYAVNNVTLVTYITPSEVGYSSKGRTSSISFPLTEKLEVERMGA